MSREGERERDEEGNGVLQKENQAPEPDHPVAVMPCDWDLPPHMEEVYPRERPPAWELDPAPIGARVGRRDAEGSRLSAQTTCLPAACYRLAARLPTARRLLARRSSNVPRLFSAHSTTVLRPPFRPAEKASAYLRLRGSTYMTVERLRD